MSSSTLFKIAGGLFLALPLGHTQMYLDVLVPHLQPLGAIPGAYASKVSWTQANGYFITTALLCFKWANGGVPDGVEKYILGVLIATQCLTAVAYLKKGIPGPSAAYLTTSLLMGIAAGKKV
ncbi:hypothetical protein OIDMADRAFT_182499 [Oidiodendron maius Zn]|uniref:Uncharacterized protein n=1 Tax=Oidiodendron maius (strain Zn) TaxID=913774 RepID=A0A0C3GQ74_OIDMZ|nr:hypothetical protein OIDMADRAFT_182499 [Oidiodendron maius Zn]